MPVCNHCVSAASTAAQAHMFAHLLCLSTATCCHRHACLCGCPIPAMPCGGTGTASHSLIMSQHCLLAPLWQRVHACSRLLQSSITVWQCRHTCVFLLCPSVATWLCKHACSHSYCAPVPKCVGMGKAVHASVEFHVVTLDYLLVLLCVPNYLAVQAYLFGHPQCPRTAMCWCMCTCLQACCAPEPPHGGMGSPVSAPYGSYHYYLVVQA